MAASRLGEPKIASVLAWLAKLSGWASAGAGARAMAKAPPRHPKSRLEFVFSMTVLVAGQGEGTAKRHG
jgi:hypothetical protein